MNKKHFKSSNEMLKYLVKKHDNNYYLPILVNELKNLSNSLNLKIVQ